MCLIMNSVGWDSVVKNMDNFLKATSWLQLFMILRIWISPIWSPPMQIIASDDSVHMVEVYLNETKTPDIAQDQRKGVCSESKNGKVMFASGGEERTRI